MTTFVPSGRSFTESQNPGPMVVFCSAPLLSMKLKRLTACEAFQYVESAVMPPIRISAGVPVRALRFSSKFFVRTLGAVVFPTNSSKKAVSMLKLPSAGLRRCDAVKGRDGGPASFRLDKARVFGSRRKSSAKYFEDIVH